MTQPRMPLLTRVAVRISEFANYWLWPQFVAFYPSYDFYQRIARGRKIPIVILEPAAAMPA